MNSDMYLIGIIMIQTNKKLRSGICVTSYTYLRLGWLQKAFVGYKIIVIFKVKEGNIMVKLESR